MTPAEKKLISSVACKLATGWDRDDAFQDGWIGLQGAVRSFEEIGVPFTAHARRRIRYAILDGRRRMNSQVRSAKRAGRLPIGIEIDRDPDTVIDAACQFAAIDDRDELEAAMKGFAAVKRTVMELVIGEGAKQRDVAKKIGVDESRVSQIMDEVARELKVRNQMKCPICKSTATGVIESRTSSGGQAVRRRRECLICKHRFTTHEKPVVQPEVIDTFAASSSFGGDVVFVSSIQAVVAEGQ